MGLDFTLVNTVFSIDMCFVFFESAVFPLVFGIGLRGRGRWTKPAAGIITAASAVGGFFLFAQLAIFQARTVQYAYCLIIGLFAGDDCLPLYLLHRFLRRGVTTNAVSRSGHVQRHKSLQLF